VILKYSTGLCIYSNIKKNRRETTFFITTLKGTKCKISVSTLAFGPVPETVARKSIKEL